MTGKAQGEVELTFLRGGARHGFLVQRATDVANQATYAPAVVTTKTTYTLTGAPSASVVHVRVAAIDPNAIGEQSPWSDWAAGMAR